jgi:hypothetical protein
VRSVHGVRDQGVIDRSGFRHFFRLLRNARSRAIQEPEPAGDRPRNDPVIQPLRNARFVLLHADTKDYVVRKELLRNARLAVL